MASTARSTWSLHKKSKEVSVAVCLPETIMHPGAVASGTPGPPGHCCRETCRVGWGVVGKGLRQVARKSRGPNPPGRQSSAKAAL